MKKLLSVLLGVSMLAMLLVGCGKTPADNSGDQPDSTSTSTEQSVEPSTEPEGPSYEPVTLNVAYMPNYGSLWAVMAAKEKGFFEEVGITINLVEFQDGPTIIAAMESGSIDVGYIGQGAHKLCVEGNATIFALSHISNGDALIGGPGITKIEDLAGKKVAYASGSSSEDILVNSLKLVGMSMNDIEAVDMDPAALVTAMLSGGVDACATWSPNSLKILDELEGATKLTDNLTFKDTTVSLASWISMPTYAQENRDILVRFTKALYQGMDYAADTNQEEVCGYVAAQVAGDVATIEQQLGDADWLTGEEVAAGAADGTVEEYYKIQKQNFIAGEVVTVDPPVTDYVMLDIMVEAAQ